MSAGHELDWDGHGPEGVPHILHAAASSLQWASPPSHPKLSYEIALRARTCVPPSAGFRTATLATSLDACAFPNPFKSDCQVTEGRTVVFQTDQSCQVSRRLRRNCAMLHLRGPIRAPMDACAVAADNVRHTCPPPGHHLPAWRPWLLGS